MTAEDILAAAEATYARCRTYADTGRVQTVFRDHNGQTNFVTTTPFETAFVRPDRFRFEFSIHSPNSAQFRRHIIVMNGPEVLTGWDIRRGVERPESLRMAIAGATGVSGGAAHTVPAMLMAERVRGRHQAARAELTRLEDGELDGSACYRIRRQVLTPPGLAGADRGHAPDVLWVDRPSLLLRRIEGGGWFPTFSTESVTTYEPAINEEVPDDHLIFDPPEA
jgi:hypothetical protein